MYLGIICCITCITLRLWVASLHFGVLTFGTWTTYWLSSLAINTPTVYSVILIMSGPVTVLLYFTWYRSENGLMQLMPAVPLKCNGIRLSCVLRLKGLGTVNILHCLVNHWLTSYIQHLMSDLTHFRSSHVLLWLWSHVFTYCPDQSWNVVILGTRQLSLQQGISFMRAQRPPFS